MRRHVIGQQRTRSVMKFLRGWGNNSHFFLNGGFNEVIMYLQAANSALGHLPMHQRDDLSNDNLAACNCSIVYK